MNETIEATERLTLSRERLRGALQPRASALAAGVGNASRSGFLSSWLNQLAAIPGAGLMVNAAKGWWSQHPWRLAFTVVAEGARAVLQPIAQVHPYRLVGVAAVFGVLIGWTRPWRWVAKPAVLAGLLPQIISRLRAGAASGPTAL